MTNGEKIKALFPNICITYDDEDMVVIDGFPVSVVSNIEFDKAWWNTEYKEPTPNNDLGVDCIKKSDAIDIIQDMHGLARADVISDAVNRIITTPSVTPQESRCKDCKWWKDSDGIYRRGCRAESQCPINRREVYEGDGYCYMFSPKTESEE